ncbi:hypothetical protein PoB_004363100, partial [Plakobranchus ocellatus]
SYWYVEFKSLFISQLAPVCLGILNNCMSRDSPCEEPVHKKVISGFQALRQTRAPMAGLAPAKDPRDGDVNPLSHQHPNGNRCADEESIVHLNSTIDTKLTS